MAIEILEFMQKKKVYDTYIHIRPCHQTLYPITKNLVSYFWQPGSFAVADTAKGKRWHCSGTVNIDNITTADMQNINKFTLQELRQQHLMQKNIYKPIKRKISQEQGN